MSSTYQAVAIGDLHLDGMNADLGPDANRRIIAEVSVAEAWAVRNGINEILYTGDICNRAVMSYDAHELLTAQWRHHTHLTRRIIAGNHDFDEVGRHSLRLLKLMAETNDFGGNVHIYTEPEQVVVAGGVKLNLLPYPYPNAEVDFETGSCLNVAHFEVKGSVRDNGSPSASKYEVDEEGVWIIGHLHTPHEIGDNVHYVGTLFQRSFGEKLPKSFTHVRARMRDGDLQVRLDRIAHDPEFRLINLNIETAADLKKVTSNPLHLYKLFVSAAVNVPQQFYVDHPNVVRNDRYRTKKEKEAMMEQKIIMSTCENDDPFDSLEEYLEERHSQLTGKQLKRADQIMTEIRSKMEAS